MRVAHEARSLELLGGRRDAVALVEGERQITYAEMEARALDLRDRLGVVRRLVVLDATPDVETVIGLLACLAGGHPVLLAPPCGASAELRATYDPDVTLRRGELVEHHAGTTHDLHPDLALLLSTSGSTGSPKLVRLSQDSLLANARAIATYLRLNPADRGITSLPLHYCYGLSVLTSHLVAGAGVVLTDSSVVDPGFLDLLARHEVTSLAGVPHTFDLLEACDFAERDLPTLRTLTQAGGRLGPDRVRAWARLGQRRGFDFVVMYGQTEATARMGYLPPELAEMRPECVGVPVPGGSWRLDDGELVFSGPNVMLGYATSAGDLALGRTVHELRTGDLAREHPDGLVEIIGRRSRFAKVFGLRIDLERVEAVAEVPARAVEHDGRIAVFVRRSKHVDDVRRRVLDAGVPCAALDVLVVEEFPLTASGKPDQGALVRQAQAARALTDGIRPASAGVTPARVRDELAALLGRPDATDADSFVTLGGDSLSYVEASLRLEQLLGGLPPRWQELSAGELARASGRRRGVEVPVLVRAAAIIAIVATHANLIDVSGGAHLLLALAGFQLARFQLARSDRLERLRGVARSVLAFAVPAGLFIGVTGAVTGMYDPITALFLHQATGSTAWDDDWQFWFLEAVVWLPLLIAVLLAIPWVDRLERRWPFGLPMLLLVATGALRFGLAGVETGNPQRYALPVVAWCLVLGWAACRASTRGQRVLVVLAAAVLTFGFFGDLQREAIVVVGVALVTCVRQVPFPRLLRTPVAWIAGSSLWVYLTHWLVYPRLEDDYPLLATLASFAVGIAVWRVQSWASARVRRSSRVRSNGGSGRRAVASALWSPRPATRAGTTSGVV